jgi:hypothetical protein
MASEEWRTQLLRARVIWIALIVTAPIYCAVTAALAAAEHTAMMLACFPRREAVERVAAA